MNAMRRIFSYIFIAFFCMPLVTVNPVLADSAKPPGKRLTSTFKSPLFQGKRLDWCKSWSQDCGKPAADDWCKTKGFEAASKYLIAENIGKSSPTKTIGKGEICNQEFCDGFQSIECYKWYCPAGSKDKCCYGKEC